MVPNKVTWITLISQTYYLRPWMTGAPKKSFVTIVTMFGSLRLSFPLFSMFVNMNGKTSTSLLLQNMRYQNNLCNLITNLTFTKPSRPQYDKTAIQWIRSGDESHLYNVWVIACLHGQTSIITYNSRLSFQMESITYSMYSGRCRKNPGNGLMLIT